MFRGSCWRTAEEGASSSVFLSSHPDGVFSQTFDPHFLIFHASLPSVQMCHEGQLLLPALITKRSGICDPPQAGPPSLIREGVTPVVFAVIRVWVISFGPVLTRTTDNNSLKTCLTLSAAEVQKK